MARRILLNITQEVGFNQGLLTGIAGAIADGLDWDLRQVGFFDRHVDLVRAWKPEGAISLLWQSAHGRIYDALGCPVVVVSGTEPAPGRPVVLVDEAEVGRIAARHFAERGLRQVAWSGFTRAGWMERRQAGFRAAAASMHLTLHERTWGGYHAESELDLEFRRESALRLWLARLPRPCGLLAVSDSHALTLARIARLVGLAIPGDLAIIGVNDDQTLCALHDPPLASIRIPAEAIGRTAATMLAGILAGRSWPAEPVLFPPGGLTLRASADATALDDHRLGRAMTCIREQASGGTDVRAIARAVGCSRRSLERRFARRGLEPPGAQLRQARLAAAEALLADTTLALADIAARSGFSSAQRLIEAFRRRHGCTPGAWRRLH
jgi:LacI family transcriptional regulator